jgi:hypothetical protein
MAISKTSAVVLSDQVDKKQVKYLNKDYSEFKKNLVDFAKFYFPDTYQDFSDASPGSIFIDMASYVGDVLSYYTDNSFKESLLAYAEERENIVAIAQGLGFKPRLTSPSFLVPADSEGNLDTRFLPRIAAGSSFGATTQFDAGTFLTEDICDFGDSNNRTVQIFSLDGGTNLPSTHIVTKICKVVSATTKTLEYTVGSPTKFLKIAMTEDNIVEVESVVDSEGNTWYEVDNLSQDYRFEDVLKSVRGSTTAPLYTIKPVKVNRRFITRLNRNNKIELVFGSGTGDLSDVYENPDYKSVYDQQYLQNMTNVSLDTLNFTNSNSFGLAPGNTTLTITYRVSNGLRSNVPSGTISKIVNINTLNETRTLSASDLATFNTMVSSITVINEDAATGGLNSPTTEQLRQSAIGFVNAQGRIVTSQDYEKRILSMPSKYGAIAKAFAMRDSAISDIDKVNNSQGATSGIDDDVVYVDDDPVNNNINLYMLGYDSDRRLISLNNDVKLNVKKFLKGYRMMTDRINILDAFRVSIGVNYTIVAYKGFNSYEVLARCSDAVAQYFNIDNWNINQPILIDDLLLTIARIEGVQSVTTIDIVNKYQQRDGRDYAPYRYDVSAEGGNRSNNIVYPSVDPCIFELRYPQNDIVGTALQ